MGERGDGERERSRRAVDSPTTLLTSFSALVKRGWTCRPARGTALTRPDKGIRSSSCGTSSYSRTCDIQPDEALTFSWPATSAECGRALPFSLSLSSCTSAGTCNHMGSRYRAAAGVAPSACEFLSKFRKPILGEASILEDRICILQQHDSFII